MTQLSVTSRLPTPASFELGEKFTVYVLVRKDIDLAQQIVQAVHAGAEAARAFYRATHGIASTVVLQVKDQRALLAAQQKLCALGLPHEMFNEPDFGMGASALATRPLTRGERRHMRGWQLWRPTPAPAPVSAFACKEAAQ
jgi:hypothetical protein